MFGLIVARYILFIDISVLTDCLLDGISKITFFLSGKGLANSSNLPDKWMPVGVCLRNSSIVEVILTLREKNKFCI